MTGKLKFENNKWKITFENEKGDTKTLFCQPSVFSQGFEPSKEEETEIDFERDTTPQQNACKVRPKGQSWQGQEKTQTVDYNRQNRQPPGRDDRNQRNNQTQSRNTAVKTLEGEFHNPYNFVPAVPRENIGNGLEDSEPIGHDRFHENHFSGKLTIKMTVETPLVVLDTAKVEIDENDHKSFPVRVNSQGKPFINPTAVKGMLRSSYEAVTNSRMSVFTKHEDRLAFRPEVGQGASVVPVKIEEDENGQKKIAFFTGTNEAKDLDMDGSPMHGNPLCAAWLPRYFNKEIDRFAPKYNDKNLPQHNEEVRIWIEKFAHWRWDRRNNIHRQDFVFWRVREIARITDKLSAKPRPTEDRGKRNGKSYYQPLNEIIEVKGIVFISNHNMQRKHDEKVFFKNSKSPESEILSEDKWKDLQTAWKELIENYRSGHEKVKGKLEPVPTSLGIKEWSRHIQKATQEKDLKPSMLCFAEVEKNSNNIFTVKRLFPVMVSRQLFDLSPFKLLEKDSHGRDLELIPAINVKNLSPADRVFGWVGKGISKHGNYRGQIRFGEILCKGLLENNFLNEEAQTIHSFDARLPMNILGQPKPQQGRFYVAKNKEGNAQERNYELNNKKAGYNLGKGLRGRKVYPHHAKLPDDYWFVQENIDFSDESNLKSGGQYREYLRPPGEKQRNDQNRSIEGWVKSKTVFEFDVHFTNLSKVELGALIWLLNLNGENENKYFHRFGGAKPYGFGSVKLEITESDVRNGKDWKNFYMSLDDEQKGKLEAADINKLKNDFDTLARAEFPSVIKSFLRACEGFADKPTHYPRKTRQPKAEGKSFEWFVENSKIERGTVKNGYVLQDLESDDGLPYLD